MSKRIFITLLLFILLMLELLFLSSGENEGVCNDLIHENGNDNYDISTGSDIILKVKHRKFGEIKSYIKGEIYDVTFEVLNTSMQLKNFILVSSDVDKRLFVGNFSYPLPYNVTNVEGCGNYNAVRGLLTSVLVVGWFVPIDTYVASPCVLLRSNIETTNSSITLSKTICQTISNTPKNRVRRGAVQSESSAICLDGWKGFGSRCYRIFHVKKEFAAAKETCASYNGSLAAMKHQNESDFINELIEVNSNLNDTYWIGATDALYESDFMWTDGTKVKFEDWFGGWPGHDYFGKQPNDDGYSEQDCVELRRKFAVPTKGYSFASRWYWNDISCSAFNGFVCQIPWEYHEKEELNLIFCNVTVSGSSGFVTSPNYPNLYPNSIDCKTRIVVLPGHRVFLEFKYFVIENHKNCNYDSVQIRDNSSDTRIICGNYTKKEKLLTFVSKTNFVDLRFVSDDWVNFSGFNASYSSQEVDYSCDDPTWTPTQGKCIKGVASPQLDWEAATVACRNTGTDATLASIENMELQEVVANKLAQDPKLSSTSQYWLSGTDRDEEGVWKWIHGDLSVDVKYTNWFQGSNKTSAQPSNIINSDCMILTNSISNETFIRYYWAAELCRIKAGYICQQPAKEIIASSPYPHEIIIQETSGVLSSPSYPDKYDNNMEITWVFLIPHGHQIVLSFAIFDVEKQRDCLYDYILLIDSFSTTRLCGNKTKFQYNSKENILNMTFSSDYSINFRGFTLSYEVLPVCQDVVFTSTEGAFQSPVSSEYNYLNSVNCWMNLTMPVDNRVVLEFDAFDLSFDSKCEKDFVEIFLSSEYAVRICGNQTLELWKLKYVSYANYMLVRFRTDQSDVSKGFRARYKSVSIYNRVTHYAEVIPKVSKNTLTSLDYPNPFPSLAFQETTFLAPTGYHATLNITEFDFGKGKTSGCSADVVVIIDYEQYGYERTLATMCDGVITNLHNFSFTSTYHKLGIRTTSGRTEAALNGGVKASFSIIKSNEIWDPGIFDPLIEKTPCDSAPCKNGGQCIVVKSTYTCKCTDEFTGIQCAEQKISYLITEPLWSGTIAIIGLLFLILIAFRLKRRCGRACNCGVEKDVESPFKSYADNEPSAIYAKYVDTDPTADAFSSLIQRLKAGAATSQAGAAKPQASPAEPAITKTESESDVQTNPTVPNGLGLPNGKLVEKNSLDRNGSVPSNGGLPGPWKTKSSSSILKVTADINLPPKTTIQTTNIPLKSASDSKSIATIAPKPDARSKAKVSLASLKKTSFSGIICNDEMEIIQEDTL